MATTPEPTFDQNLAMIVSQLPPSVRAFFVSGKVEIVAQKLIQKYQLHIDQGAIVDREIVLLLLGLKSPAEFSKALAEEARLDQKVITSIVQDINAQIFVPLREEEMKGGEGSLMPTAPAAPAQAPAQPTSHFHLQNKINPPARSAQQPSLVKPLVSVLQGNPPARFTQPARPAIAAPSPAASNTLLEDHEEPHIEFNKAPAPVSSILAQKAAAPQSPLGEVLSRIIPPGGRPAFATAPKTAFPTQAPPRANPPQTPSAIASPAAASQPSRSPSVPKPTLSGAPAPVLPKAPSAPAKPYSTDPYREPIE